MTGSQASPKRERVFHETTFRGRPLLLRLPVLQDEIEARIQAARALAADLGEQAKADDDLERVDMPTLMLLSNACRDPNDRNGPPMFGTPRMFAQSVTSDEHLELLHKLNGARAEHAGVRSGPEDLEFAVTTLASCESERSAYEVLAPFDHERMVRLCWSMAQTMRAMAEEGVVFDADDVAEGEES